MTIYHEHIPMDEVDIHACRVLHTLLDHEPLYVVGGFVRDHLYGKYHNLPVRSHDIDLTCGLSEEYLISYLTTRFAKHAGVKVHTKDSVDTFGVVFVTIDGRTYEIAPFRKDVGSADGRRPERIEYASMREDALRRDLTMNALYYDFMNCEIIDHVGGVEDIKQGVVRCVGDPMERFEEDKLRVLRFVRFLSRYTPGCIIDHIDADHLNALQHFADMPGVTGERILQELLAGIEQSLHTSHYLENLFILGLHKRMFGEDILVDLNDIMTIGNMKNVKVILAFLLRHNEDVGRRLQQLKYPADIFDVVDYYIDATTPKMNDVLKLLRGRMRIEIKGDGLHRIHSDLAMLAMLIKDPIVDRRIAHLVSYREPKIDAQKLMDQGITGPELGRKINELIAMDYYHSRIGGV